MLVAHKQPMNLLRTLVALVPFASLMLTACSPYVSGATALVQTPVMPPRPVESVALHVTTLPTEPYREALLLTTTHDEEDGVPALRTLAAKHGCDAIILLDPKTTVSNRYPFVAIVSDDPYTQSSIETEHEQRGVCAVYERSVAALALEATQKTTVPPLPSPVRGVVVSRVVPSADSACVELGPLRDEDEGSYNRARVRLAERAKGMGARYFHLREVTREGDLWRLEGMAYRCRS